MVLVVDTLDAPRQPAWRPPWRRYHDSSTEIVGSPSVEYGASSGGDLPAVEPRTRFWPKKTSPPSRRRTRAACRCEGAHRRDRLRCARRPPPSSSSPPVVRLVGRTALAAGYTAALVDRGDLAPSTA